MRRVLTKYLWLWLILLGCVLALVLPASDPCAQGDYTFTERCDR